MALTSVVLLLTLVATGISSSLAFSVSSTAAQRQQEQNPERPPIVPRTFIDLNNPAHGAALQQNRLPASFVGGWPTWILGQDGVFVKIPDSDGFVSPSSIDELWQPVDLKSPELRLALGVHIRQGVIRHIMPAVDLAYMAEDGYTLQYRNRGLNTVPRAYAWVDFINSATEYWDEYRLCLSHRRPTEEEWTMVHSKCFGTVGNAVQRTLMSLSQTPPDELGDGSHIIHVLLDENDPSVGSAVDCPNPGIELRVTMIHQDDIDDLEYIGDDSKDEASLPGIGTLQVVIASTLPGSESESLPDVYRTLYSDKSLRRPAYAKYKERQEARKSMKYDEEVQ